MQDGKRRIYKETKWKQMYKKRPTQEENRRIDRDKMRTEEEKEIKS